MPSFFPGMDPFIEGYDKSQRQSAVATVEPVERSLPGPLEMQEKYLVIRQLNSAEVVTVIELLSPSNKRTGSEGR